MLLSCEKKWYEACDSKKPKIIKEQEASWFWNTLGITTLLSKIPLLGLLLF